MAIGRDSNTPAQALLRQEEGISCPSAMSKETKQSKEDQEKRQESVVLHKAGRLNYHTTIVSTPHLF